MTLDRLLIVGLGSIGKRHAGIARSLVPGLRIGALRDRSGSTPASGVVDASFTSLGDALRFGPQAAVVSNPAPHHLEAARALAEAGVHLLVEKPLSHTSEGVEELLETVRAHGITLMIGYNLRFMPSLQRFREAIRAGAVGRVLSVRAEVGQYLPDWRPGTDYRQSVSARSALGGGVLLELSHEIDYLRWIFGEVRWVSAVLCRQSALEIDVEDTAHLVLGFTGSDSGTPPVATLNMDFIRHDTARGCNVIGETGSLRWNALTETVDMLQSGSPAWRTIFSHRPECDESYREEWRHFLKSIADGTPPSVCGDDGLAVVRIVEAARRSSGERTVMAGESLPAGR